MDGTVRFLDQTRLPNEEMYVETSDCTVIAEAIIALQLRGAPLIGIAAAYGLVLGVQRYKHAPVEKFLQEFEESKLLLMKTRPTAKNLFWALERMEKSIRLTSIKDSSMLFDIVQREAASIHAEDRAMCDAVGKFGAELIPQNAIILTHCNTGALATGGIGTAFGVIHTAAQQGKNIFVYADETRPLLQGSRLTMWELKNNTIPSALITDNTAAWTIKQKKVNVIIVGADRIAANGDTANKIGTYNLAILANEHGIPFYIAAPSSTIDLSLSSGDEIPIEERSADEVLFISGKRIAPDGVSAFSPAFDITPQQLITAIITEKGIHYPPYTVSLTKASGI
jgi:methylthioribose-1-phosphate isomerase